MKLFAQWAGDREPNTITAGEIELDYLGQWHDEWERRNGRPPSDNTKRNHIQALRALYRFLDRIEGHRTEVDPENYRPITVTVELGGDRRDAHTYVGDDDARRRCSSVHPDAKPRPDYLRAILDGAHAVGLPASYVRALATTIDRQPRGRGR